MTAAELNERTQAALRITGAPTWPSPEDPDGLDELAYVANDLEADAPYWALTPVGMSADEPEGLMEIHRALAAELIAAHLRAWLQGRGWQIQMSVRQGKVAWRLADCVAVIDGGGDRLDGDYPAGSDELSVLCEAVVAIARGT